MTGKESFRKFGFVIEGLIKVVSVLPRSVRLSIYRTHRNTNGKRGLLIRYIFMATLAKRIGQNVSILPGCYIKYPENIEIGNNVSIQPMCFLGGGGGIVIGDDVSIAHGSTILSTTHTFDRNDIPIKYQEIKNKKTVIENNVWIGCGVTIVAGCHIGSNAVIGANSVVLLDTPESSVIAGSPAKVIKKIWEGNN